MLQIHTRERSGRCIIHVYGSGGTRGASGRQTATVAPPANCFLRSCVPVTCRLTSSRRCPVSPWKCARCGCDIKVANHSNLAASVEQSASFIAMIYLPWFILMVFILIVHCHRSLSLFIIMVHQHQRRIKLGARCGAEGGGEVLEPRGVSDYSISWRCAY